MINEGADVRPGHENFRRVLLRVLFWALGLAACFGAAGVIFAGHETLWRVVWTCAATAAGALLILGASRLLDVDLTWPQGVSLIAVTVFEYVGTLGLIWHIFGRAAEPTGLTLVFLAITAIPAIAFSAGLGRAETTVLARVGIAASAFVFVLLGVAAWGDYLAALRADRWYNVASSFACFAGLAVACLVGVGVDRRHWRWLGIAAAVVAFTISAYTIFFDIREASTFFICATSVAVVVAHASLMVRVPLRRKQQWLLWGTVGTAIATAAFVDVARITRPWQEDILGRLAGAAAIIAGCGTLALLVLAKINRRATPSPTSVSELREITVACPRCHHKQSVAIGEGSCGICGLVIQVRVREAGEYER